MKKYIRLGVNIDHVATLRNARGGSYPDILKAARLVENSGADSITIHLREDRRHINEADLVNLIKNTKLPINLEIAANNEIIEIALKNRPKSICIVPENREEITTEGGLDIIKNFEHLKKCLESFSKTSIELSFFIDPSREQILATKDLGVKTIEFHTGSYANAFENKKDLNSELKKIRESVDFAHNLNLKCHAGHGLNFDNVVAIAQIPNIVELNIGHFIIADSIFNGLQKSIRKMRNIINKASK